MIDSDLLLSNSISYTSSFVFVLLCVSATKVDQTDDWFSEALAFQKHQQLVYLRWVKMIQSSWHDDSLMLVFFCFFFVCCLFSFFGEVSSFFVSEKRKKKKIATTFAFSRWLFFFFFVPFIFIYFFFKLASPLSWKLRRKKKDRYQAIRSVMVFDCLSVGRGIAFNTRNTKRPIISKSTRDKS